MVVNRFYKLLKFQVISINVPPVLNFFIVFLFLGLLLGGCSSYSRSSSISNNKTVSDDQVLFDNTDALSKEKKMTEILECTKNNDKVELEKCYDSFIREKFSFKTTKQLIEELDSDANTDDELRLLCHDIAHAIGRNTFYKFNKSIPSAFEQCVQTCHAGCYHGVIQGFFLGEDYQKEYDSHITIAEMKEKIKMACKPLELNIKENFQCLHGMGHAIQFYVDNNLTIALDICDTLSKNYDRNSCYGGVFMENIVSVNKETRQIKLDSPLYPCDNLDEKYKYQCYLMQTSIMIEIFGENPDKIIDACKKADKDYVQTCFISFGRDRSNYVRIKSELPYDDIKKIDDEYQMKYMAGLIYALVDNTWSGYYAFPFCSKLDEDKGFDKKLKDGCYTLAINYLKGAMAKSKEEVMRDCENNAPSNDRSYCIEKIV